MSETAKDKLERLEAENEQLKKDIHDKSQLKLKVSQKGAVSVYGLGRFPVTLYKEQFERLLEIKDKILQFINDNSKELKTKN